jgi:hypothetical protein
MRLTEARRPAEGGPPSHPPKPPPLRVSRDGAWARLEGRRGPHGHRAVAYGSDPWTGSRQGTVALLRYSCFEHPNKGSHQSTGTSLKPDIRAAMEGIRAGGKLRTAPGTVEDHSAGS